MTYFYVQRPIVDMREYPNTGSKVVSQAIFSEKVELVDEKDGWVSIITPDRYSGWVPIQSLMALKEPYETTAKISRLAAHIYAIKDIEYGPLLTLPYGARLKVLTRMDDRWSQIALPDAKIGYIQNGDIEPEPKLEKKQDLVAFSRRFTGLPYTWGGRSSFGYDCSSFVQMLYNQIGIDLQRDARQQILDPRLKEILFESLERGDLVFFGKAHDRIMHVGLYIGEGRFIHSTSREYRPWIRISSLSDPEWSGSSAAYYPFRTARQLIG